MPKFDFRVEWKDSYLYITEECGKCCKYPCNTPAEVGEYVINYIEAIQFQFDKHLENKAKEYELMEENREW